MATYTLFAEPSSLHRQTRNIVGMFHIEFSVQVTTISLSERHCCCWYIRHCSRYIRRMSRHRGWEFRIRQRSHYFNLHARKQEAQLPRHESRTVCCRNVQLMPRLFLKLTKIWQLENGKFVAFNHHTQVWRRPSKKRRRISTNNLYCQKLELLAYISVADSMGLRSLVFT